MPPSGLVDPYPSPSLACRGSLGIDPQLAVIRRVDIALDEQGFVRRLVNRDEFPAWVLGLELLDAIAQLRVWRPIGQCCLTSICSRPPPRTSRSVQHDQQPDDDARDGDTCDRQQIASRESQYILVIFSDDVPER